MDPLCLQCCVDRGGEGPRRARALKSDCLGSASIVGRRQRGMWNHDPHWDLSFVVLFVRSLLVVTLVLGAKLLVGGRNISFGPSEGGGKDKEIRIKLPPP